MTGLDKKLSEGKKMPKKAAMVALDATSNTSYTEFAGKLRDAVGTLKGRKITDPVPLAQIDPALKKALGLKTATPYTKIVQKTWGGK
jgi:hypothetical protein